MMARRMSEAMATMRERITRMAAWGVGMIWERMMRRKPSVTPRPAGAKRCE